MTTASTNTICDQSTDLNYQTWINELITQLLFVGVTQTADICQLTTGNINASVVVNAQTATSVLTVNSITSGGSNICVGMTVTGAGVPANTFIASVGSGTGGTGTYNLTTTPGTIAAESMTITLSHPTAGSQTLGYSMFRFNDTLQATLPIFFKLEYGSGSSGGNYPNLILTLGTGSNGSGTITNAGYTQVTGGAALPRQTACGWGANVGNNTTSYVSRWCYNATQGFCGFVGKIGEGAATNAALHGFFIFRTVNTSGAPTADGFMSIQNNYQNPGTSGGGYSTIFAANNSTVYNNSGNSVSTQMYCISLPPFQALSTTGGGTAGQIFPVWQLAPASATGPMNWGITNACAFGEFNEIAIGSTVTVTVLGSTSLTYLAVSAPFGYTQIAAITFGSAGNYTWLMLWQ